MLIQMPKGQAPREAPSETFKIEKLCNAIYYMATVALYVGRWTKLHVVIGYRSRKDGAILPARDYLSGAMRKICLKVK